MRQIALAGLLTVVTALGSAAAATGTAAATDVRPVPAAAPVAHDLFSVSCLTAKNCLAVGQDLNAFSGAGGPLAQKWNGASWRLVPVRLPAGATAGGLGQVTCLSATDCRAVGFYARGTQFPLLDTWNGATWTPTRLPGIGGRFTALEGVACASKASCVAVGGYAVNGPSAMALADIWNGRQWTQTRPPAPPGTTLSVLLGVSCASAVFCVADGLYDTSTGGGGFIVSWNGRAWSSMKAARPRNTTGGYLLSVSCRTAKACVAVGFTTNSKHRLVTVAQAWNGTGWALAGVPWPLGTVNPELTGVSCPAAGRCVAVGALNQNLVANSNQGKAGAATWNGKAWTVTPTPAPAPGTASLFNGVTCLTSTSCVAVGQTGPAGGTNGTGLSGFWNGTRWRLVAAK